MPRQILPVALAIGVGLIVLVDLLLPGNLYLHAISSTLIAWTALLAAFAFLLGLLNLLAVHARRLAQHDAGSAMSLVVLLSAAATLVLTLPEGPSGAVSQWVFQNVYRPLESSFLALLAFFIFAAAYRSLRVRSLETLILFLVALVVLVGQTPLGAFFLDWLPAVKDWILQVPVLAGVRGILMGVALGTIATALRLLLGLDRPYAD